MLTSVLAIFVLAATSAPVNLFDGRTLAGWEGDPKYWSVEDGVITGGSRSEEIPHNIFLATRASFDDFELQLEMRITGNRGFVNSGIQIRSSRKPGSTEMVGYQVDAGEGYWGQLYDESRRNRMIAEAQNPKAVLAAVHPQGWNTFRIHAEGRHIRTWINGVAALDYTEPDPGIPQSGVLGIQVHGEGVTLVEVRNVSLRTLR